MCIRDRGAPAVSTAAPMGRVSTAEAVSSRWARVKGSFPATRPAVSPPSMEPVSYTHLDVYKRQTEMWAESQGKRRWYNWF